MKEFGAFEAKNKFEVLPDLVELGDAAFERIRARAKAVESEFDWEALKAERDADRP